MNLDWTTIRPLNGSRSEGFEELCAQLARSESPSDAEFVRKGHPDAGVECYWLLADGSEWAWQAKYFDTLGSAQWSQIDESVKTALDKHPNLVRYYVCVPLDRPDARVEGQKSAMQRWHEHVAKWKSWACDRGMIVEFHWWGASELLHRLPEHAGLLSFWFGELRLDSDWFESRLNRAVQAAGSRYTPEIHVNSPTTRELELFGRTEAAFDSIKALAPGIRDALSWVRTGAPNSGADASLEKLLHESEGLLAAFSAIAPTPSGPCPFADIAQKIKVAMSAAEESIVLQGQRAQEWDATNQDHQERLEYRRNPFIYLSNNIRSLSSTLREALSQVRNADEKCSGQLLVLTGEAGCGKTHLLCDLARERLAADAPTVLLMGQQFRSSDEPWTQALTHLDIRMNTAEEFVGALEAAAQAANCRALVIVDALNEGNGRGIWRDHLAAFLEHLAKSPWIGVLLAVRKNYKGLLIPENVQKTAIDVEHLGFAGQEYEAAEAFFSHYDIKFISVPILNPEFQRPLFLKTLCEGLKGLGKRELPTGFQGISETFNLYIETINRRLADRLDYDPSDNLVRRALENLAENSLDADTQWIAPGQARDVVDALLPGKSFSESLFQGLISEGVLIKDLVVRSGDINDEVVYIVYERFADHIAADLMLRAYVDPERPADAFEADGELRWVRKDWARLRHGLIEALCIQVPERTGRELFDLLPEFRGDECLDWSARGAFRQSLIWRRTDAFTDATPEILNECMCHGDEWEETLDTLLMVSTIPEHPFNAKQLHRYLLGFSMPERDAFWSVYLYYSWDSQSPVDRLVSWASRISTKDAVDELTTDLSAIVLAWMFTSSNRFLRDRATKALVSLLTGRLESTRRLVERFADVNDPYVSERVYATAYGVAMRSHDVDGVGQLASIVYKTVFSSGSTPAHILLRDYARGVLERALHIGCRLSLDFQLVRPPYRSEWPYSEGNQADLDLSDVRAPSLQADEDSHIADRLISRSVMDGDFATYIIERDMRDWLSVLATAEPWRSPAEKEEVFLSGLSAPAAEIWSETGAAKQRIQLLGIRSLRVNIREIDLAENVPELQSCESERDQRGYPDNNAEMQQDEARLEILLERFYSQLTPEQRREFDLISKERNENPGGFGPHFDSEIVKRYILTRVHELGWSAAKIGWFDQQLEQIHWTRQAWKAERIGKKYQWIAYHEILAYISDHFQYREQFAGDSDQTYDGPWQMSIRDIDPSCTLPSVPGSASPRNHIPSWWRLGHILIGDKI